MPIVMEQYYNIVSVSKDAALTIYPFCNVWKYILVDGLKNYHNLASIENLTEIKLRVVATQTWWKNVKGSFSKTIIEYSEILMWQTLPKRSLHENVHRSVSLDPLLWFSSLYMLLVCEWLNWPLFSTGMVYGCHWT